jgi:hypothetical protein
MAREFIKSTRRGLKVMEYKTRIWRGPKYDLDPFINEIAKDGWRLHTLRDIDYWDNKAFLMVFERKRK